MNCGTCHFELSQCLDGRLPSGRRAVVMAHVESCDRCARFWTELQRAQELVLRLPPHRVGRDFREQLFARIEAGEGTPPAVFREAVPFATKVRYAATGAAAAAAMLIAASLLRSSPGDEPADDPAGGARLVATNDDANARPGDGARIVGPAEPRGDVTRPGPTADNAALAADSHGTRPLQRRQPSGAGSGGDASFAFEAAPFAAFRPLTSDLLAVEAARRFENQYRWTDRNLARLQDGANESAAATTPIGEIFDTAIELKELGQLLLDMRNDRLVSFDDPDVEVDLTLLVRTLDGRLLRQRSLETVEHVVVPAVQNSRRLGELSRTLEVRPVVDEMDPQSLLRLTFGRRDLVDRIFLRLPPVDPTFPRDVRVIFFLHDDCGPHFVVPRRQLVQRFSSR